ncbi:MAG: hypothetical protein IRZ16_14780 [Myxococcaceae bacterium]|nr:hypothetical protein [Myxococcaceae bacterium]
MAQPASLRSYLAITFSGLSATIYCLPFGIVGAILGHLEVQAIDRGEAPLSGRGYANAARWIGVVTGGLTIAIALIGGVLALISAVD